MDVKGIKVGLVGIYELYDHLEREQQLKDNIAKVKADGAQLIVVIFHWGNETETVPDSNQTTLGRIASMKALILYADIIRMYFRALKLIRVRILYTASETSASAATVLQVIWTP